MMSQEEAGFAVSILNRHLLVAVVFEWRLLKKCVVHSGCVAEKKDGEQNPMTRTSISKVLKAGVQIEKPLKLKSNKKQFANVQLDSETSKGKLHPKQQRQVKKNHKNVI